MPALTRRREKDRQQERWQVFYGDVQVGWIGERAGVPKDVEQWGWHCGLKADIGAVIRHVRFGPEADFKGCGASRIAHISQQPVPN